VIPESWRRAAKPTASAIHLAELCLERADYRQARSLLEKRLGKGARDFKTQNLLGISQAKLGKYDKAQAIFQRLTRGRLKLQRDKAHFNLALSLLSRDLGIIGDCTVAATTGAKSRMADFPKGKSPFIDAYEAFTAFQRRNTHYGDLIQAYLAFTYLQMGKIDEALEAIIEALQLNENSYISQYVLGRIFLDLYFLSEEGSDFAIAPKVAEFFEIQPYEVIGKLNERTLVSRETFLDIALQGLLESRQLNEASITVLLWLGRCYLAADMIEEAHETLALVETLTPDAKMTIELALQLHEKLQTSQDNIRLLVTRLSNRGDRPHAYALLGIMPSYYLS
jgi:tetratricopeptide (TPR) repeat protein